MTTVTRNVVLLLGAPGAGKGTQARFLTDILGVPHVSSGDLLREHRRNGTALGAAAESYMTRGELVPDELVIDMVVKRLDGEDAFRGALLDGFPRTREQAAALDERLASRATGVRAALYLEVPQLALIERLAGRWMCGTCQSTYHEHFASPHVAGVCDACGGTLFQRDDDRLEVVERRVAVYLRDTLPVVEHYAHRGVLHNVDGAREIDMVRAELCFSLGGAIIGERHNRWHLFVAHGGPGADADIGRTLCGKIVHPRSEAGRPTLAEFFSGPCRGCRRALRSLRSTGNVRALVTASG